MNENNICSKKGEQFMWVLTKKDGTKITEFDEAGKQTDFKIIQCKPDTKNFGIVGQGIFINFDTLDGIFKIMNYNVKPKLIDNEGNDLLVPDKENKLIMFRTNEKNMNTGRDQIIGYSVGYRIKNEYLNARVFIEISRKGPSLHLDFTPTKTIEGELGIFNNNVRCALIESDNKDNHKIFTNRRYNLNLQLAISKNK